MGMGGGGDEQAAAACCCLLVAATSAACHALAPNEPAAPIAQPLQHPQRLRNRKTRPKHVRAQRAAHNTERRAAGSAKRHPLAVSWCTFACSCSFANADLSEGKGNEGSYK